MAYNLLLSAAGLLVSPALLLLAALDIKAFRKRLTISEPGVIDSRKSILIHGASLGEMAVVKKLIPLIKEAYPYNPIVVSVTSESGYKNITETMRDEISHALYLPMEFLPCIRRSLKTVNPELIIITETELWPNFISEAKQQGIKTILLNGRISDRTIGKYMLFRSIFGPVLDSFDVIGAQSEEYRQRFISIGANPGKVVVTGNIKEVIHTDNNAHEKRAKARRQMGLSDTHWLFIAASTREGEEEVILDSFTSLFEKYPDIILLIAPRHLERVDAVIGIIEERKIPYERRSKILNNLSEKTRLIVLDSHGELSMLYHAGEAAFVGGTLVDIGGHNLMEPLCALLPVCFGPSVHQQKVSAQKLRTSNIGFMINNSEELFKVVEDLHNDKSLSLSIRERIATLLESSREIEAANRALISR